MREADVSQHALERFVSGARVYPSTRAKLAQAIDKLERATWSAPVGSPNGEVRTV